VLQNISISYRQWKTTASVSAQKSLIRSSSS